MFSVGSNLVTRDTGLAMVQGVVHEFNNILCIIKMATDDIMADRGMAEHGLESAGDILNMVERAASINRQLLTINGLATFHPRELDMNEMIAGRVKAMKRIVGERVELQVNSAPEAVLVHADPSMMDQLVLNLMVNACDAMPDGGKLAVEVTEVEIGEFVASQLTEARVGAFASLSVTDSGCGIAPELLAKVFDPFFCTNGSGKCPGLGMATVFAIVRQHQGWISVKSVVGHGTAVSVYIPRLFNPACAAEVEQSWTT